MPASDLNLWDKLCVLVVGKRVAVLGQPEVGKTTLHRRLTGEGIDARYVPTIIAKPVPATRPSVESPAGRKRKLAIKKGHDVPGAFSRSQEDWRDEVMTSDVVLYLFSAPAVLARNQNHLDSIRNECGTLAKFLKARTDEGRGSPSLVVMAGNRADEIKGWTPGEDSSRVADLYRVIAEDPVIDAARLALGSSLLRTPDVVLGSLLKAPEEFITHMFGRILR